MKPHTVAIQWRLSALWASDRNRKLRAQGEDSSKFRLRQTGRYISLPLPLDLEDRGGAVRYSSDTCDVVFYPVRGNHRSCLLPCVPVHCTRAQKQKELGGTRCPTAAETFED